MAPDAVTPAAPFQQRRRPTALITGASAGIGLELAKQFALHDHDLILVARREESLKALAADLSVRHKVRITVCAADLSKGSAAHQIRRFTSEQGLTVDVLVNNAGYGANGSFKELELALQLEMIQVNISSLVELTHLYLPDMLKIQRPGAGVINVASTAAFLPGPFMAVYYATKAFVLSFSEALANELQGSGVSVSCLCPGPTTTEFQQRAKLSQSRLFTGATVMTAEKVAQEAFAGFKAGKSVIVTGGYNQLAAFSTRLMPRSVAANLARRLQEPTRP